MRSLKASILNAGLAAGLVFGGAACEALASEPEAGAIVAIKKSKEEQYKSEYSCLPEIGFDGDLHISCKNRDKYVGTIATKVITLAACKREGENLVIASEEHLRSHQDYPSDYPVVSEGVTEDNVRCGAQVEIVATAAKGLKIGSYVTIASLNAHRPERIVED